MTTPTTTQPYYKTTYARIAGVAMAIVFSVCIANGSFDTETTTTTSTNQSTASNTNDLVTEIIPLSDIWALNMPGTRRMSSTRRGNPPTYESPEGELVREIVAALTYSNQLSSAVRERLASSYTGSLVVSGRGIDALRESHAILVNGQTPRTTFRRNEILSVLFFTLPSSQFIHLSNAQQHGEIIQLGYQIVPHKTKQMTTHIALVPVLNPGSGHIKVVIKPSANGNSHINNSVGLNRNFALSNRTIINPSLLAHIKNGSDINAYR